MAEIDVPGDEAERMHMLLGRMLDLRDTKAPGCEAATAGSRWARLGPAIDRKTREGRSHITCNGSGITCSGGAGTTGTGGGSRTGSSPRREREAREHPGAGTGEGSGKKT